MELVLLLGTFLARVRSAPKQPRLFDLRIVSVVVWLLAMLLGLSLPCREEGRRSCYQQVAGWLACSWWCRHRLAIDSCEREVNAVAVKGRIQV
jgi:hypothetical protein